MLKYIALDKFVKGYKDLSLNIKDKLNQVSNQTVKKIKNLDLSRLFFTINP